MEIMQCVAIDSFKVACRAWDAGVTERVRYITTHQDENLDVN